MLKLICTFFILLSAGLLQAQSKYWVFFRDKAGETQAEVSKATIQNRQQLGLALHQFSDLKIKQAYLDSLRNLQVEVITVSRWLNGVSAMLSDEQIAQLSQSGFVKEIRPIHPSIKVASRLHPKDWQKVQTNEEAGKRIMAAPLDPATKAYPEYLGMALSQMEASSFIEKGISGKGVTIGVIDAGYHEANTTPSLAHVFANNRILGFKDFVNPAQPLSFNTQETMLDFHGTTVLTMIAGFDSARSTQFGLARDAAFYLARTDHGKKEFRGEEDYWVAALEWMDSLGVRLVNTSLGYALGFDDPAENYQPAQMDGKTSVIARAAQIAAEEKGMLIIVSAGNDGDNPYWHVISTPADAPGVMAVGATPADARDRIGYSGMGPEYLSYLKPNVSCFSLTGTSFSAPVITGMAACLMQLNPALSNKELMSLIEKAGHLYPYGNNYLGYGVPNSHKAILLVSKGAEAESIPDAEEIKVQGTKVRLPAELTNFPVVVFHKKSPVHVTKQERLKVKRKHVEINKPVGVVRSTADLGDKIVEIIWE